MGNHSRNEPAGPPSETRKDSNPHSLAADLQRSSSLGAQGRQAEATLQQADFQLKLPDIHQHSSRSKRQTVIELDEFEDLDSEASDKVEQQQTDRGDSGDEVGESMAFEASTEQILFYKKAIQDDDKQHDEGIISPHSKVPSSTQHPSEVDLMFSPKSAQTAIANRQRAMEAALQNQRQREKEFQEKLQQSQTKIDLSKNQLKLQQLPSNMTKSKSHKTKTSCPKGHLHQCGKYVPCGSEQVLKQEGIQAQKVLTMLEKKSEANSPMASSHRGDRSKNKRKNMKKQPPVMNKIELTQLDLGASRPTDARAVTPQNQHQRQSPFKDPSEDPISSAEVDDKIAPLHQNHRALNRSETMQQRSQWTSFKANPQHLSVQNDSKFSNTNKRESKSRSAFFNAERLKDTDLNKQRQHLQSSSSSLMDGQDTFRAHVSLTISQAIFKPRDGVFFYLFNPQICLVHKGKDYMTPTTVNGGMRVYFNHTIEFQVESMNEEIMILCAREEDDELTQIGQRKLKVSDIISRKAPYRVNKWFNVFENDALYTGKVRLKSKYYHPEKQLPKSTINDTKPQESQKPLVRDGFGNGPSSNDLRDNSSTRYSDFSEDLADQESLMEEDQLAQDDADDELVLLGIATPGTTKNRKVCILYQQDKLKIVWELIIAFILLVTCFTTPLNLAFQDLESGNNAYKAIIVMIDLLFAIDIVVNFFCATQDENFKVIDNRKEIALHYLKGWFIIDALAIFPFELMITGGAQIDDNASASSANDLIRALRIGKLYKLVKITRMLRLFKIFKQQGKIFQHLTEFLKVGEGFERFVFSLLIFIMISHFIACLWILTADVSSGGERDKNGVLSESTNWIIANNYSNMTHVQLYATSMYFTITTMTTVGYGDISGTNTFERIICMLLMIMGVIFFSVSSGTLTAIITNYEEVSAKARERLLVLQKLYKDYKMPQELYYQLLRSIEFETTNDMDEINEFVNSIPYKLRTKVIMLAYRSTYQRITFLQYKPHNFVVWLCPLLKPGSVLQDHYIYYENDQIESMYFLSKGAAGYVLPFRKNIVYVQIDEGDDFGQTDIVTSCMETGSPIIDMLKNTEGLVRQFSVQALSDVECLTLSVKTLQRMSQEFFEAFQQLFSSSELRLKRILQQKLRAIKYSHDVVADNDQVFTARFKNTRIERKRAEDLETDPLDNNYDICRDIVFHKKSTPLTRLCQRSISSSSSESNNEDDDKQFDNESLHVVNSGDEAVSDNNVSPLKMQQSDAKSAPLHNRRQSIHADRFKAIIKSGLQNFGNNNSSNKKSWLKLAKTAMTLKGNPRKTQQRLMRRMNILKKQSEVDLPEQSKKEILVRSNQVETLLKAGMFETTMNQISMLSQQPEGKKCVKIKADQQDGSMRDDDEMMGTGKIDWKWLLKQAGGIGDCNHDHHQHVAKSEHGGPTKKLIDSDSENNLKRRQSFAAMLGEDGPLRRLLSQSGKRAREAENNNGGMRLSSGSFDQSPANGQADLFQKFILSANKNQNQMMMTRSMTPPQPKGSFRLQMQSSEVNGINNDMIGSHLQNNVVIQKMMQDMRADMEQKQQASMNDLKDEIKRLKNKEKRNSKSKKCRKDYDDSKEE